MSLSVSPSLFLLPELLFLIGNTLSTIDFVTYSCCIELGGGLNVEGVTAVTRNHLVQKRSIECG